jgi:hypothetical protein
MRDALAARWAKLQEADAREWLRVSAEAGEFAREFSGRSGVLVTCEPMDSDEVPTARWLPERSMIEINTTVCALGVDPAHVALDTHRDRLDHPALAGALTHEAAHARYTHWYPRAENPRDPEARAVLAATLLLEEPRIEAHAIREDPTVGPLLRSTWEYIVNGTAPVDVDSAARSAALTAARVDGGVLDVGVTRPLVRLTETLLGLGRFCALQAVWRAALALPTHDDWEAMEALGRRWVEILRIGREGEEPSDDSPIVIVMPCGVPAEGESEGESEGEGVLVVVRRAVSDAAEREVEGEVERERVAAAVADAEAEASDQEAAREAATVVLFGGHGSSGNGRESLGVLRSPDADERRAAAMMARAFREAQYRERATTTITSALPGGRLRGGAAVLRSAQIAQGMVPTAEPWRRKEYRYVPEPPLRVGVLCDISGSMSKAAGPVASLAWALNRAVSQIDGATATFAYGVGVHVVSRPGRPATAVQTFGAHGAWENITTALYAVDGALDLTANRSGARLLVNVSDGRYGHGTQRADGERLTTRLIHSGVKVLWLGLSGPDEDWPFPGTTYVHVGDPADLGRIVAAAARRVLESA